MPIHAITSEPLGKRCATCRESKPLLDFPPDRSRFNGLSPMCRVCKRLAATRYNHTEKARASRAKYEQTDAGKVVRKAARAKYRQSEKGKLARKQEAVRRNARRVGIASEPGDYSRNAEHTRQLHALCKRLITLIFNDPT